MLYIKAHCNHLFQILIVLNTNKNEGYSVKIYWFFAEKTRLMDSDETNTPKNTYRIPFHFVNKTFKVFPIKSKKVLLPPSLTLLIMITHFIY